MNPAFQNKKCGSKQVYVRIILKFPFEPSGHEDVVDRKTGTFFGDEIRKKFLIAQRFNQTCRGGRRPDIVLIEKRFCGNLCNLSLFGNSNQIIPLSRSQHLTILQIQCLVLLQNLKT
jgi:hypothetical protein